jgi:hypothetical protein
MAILSALVAAACVTGMLLPRPVFGQDTETRPGIAVDREALRVRVHAADGVGEAYVREAVAVARELLTGAGVVTVWSVCVDLGCPIDEVRAAAIVVIFQDTSDPRQPGQCGRAALGHAEGSGTVRVSVPCVAAVPARLRQRLDTGSHPLLAMSRHHDLTGAVVAHEVGHVLGLRHGPTGVMREQFDRNDIVTLRTHRLAFTEPDALAMQRSAERAGGRGRSVLARR